MIVLPTLDSILFLRFYYKILQRNSFLNCLTWIFFPEKSIAFFSKDEGPQLSNQQLFLIQHVLIISAGITYCVKNCLTFEEVGS